MLHSLGLEPYRPHLLHDLNDNDRDRRMEFNERCLIIHDANLGFTGKTLWTDAGTFRTNGRINRRNCVYWRDKTRTK
jgi:hypothetical protein